MRAKDIFDMACSFIDEQPDSSPDLLQLTPSFLNSLLVEALGTENSRRRYEGLEELAEAPKIKSVEDLEEDIPYREDICRVALVFGLVSYFYINDDENSSRADDYRARFVVALAEAIRVREEKVVDVYA